MKLHRTQVYLPGDTHRRLGRDAAERGMSLAAYVREVVEAHYARRGAALSASFDDLIGCVDETPAGDVATAGADYREQALREVESIGGLALDVTTQTLGPRLLESYLRVKERGLL